MTKRAIVLGGCGARGPYQIGVWQALRELGLDYQIITGSSVGALNGAFMVQGDYEKARAMWESLSTGDVVAEAPELSASPMPAELLNFMGRAVSQGGLDITPLENILRETVDEEKIRQSDIAYGIVTSQYPFMRPVQLMKEEIPEGELVDYMLASSSWFPFFRRRTIDGVDYVDGAYADNLPAELAVKCGATEIIAIDLQGTGIVHTFRGEIPVRYIRSHWNLGEMLVFDTEVAKRNIRMGYLDGLKAYRRLEGNAYTFYQGETKQNACYLRDAIVRIAKRTGVSFWKQYQRLPRIQEMLRYRGLDHRFLPRRLETCTLGQAITTAAEIAGELMYIPPDETYTLRGFNKLLLEQLRRLQSPAEPHRAGDLFRPQQQTAEKRPGATLFRLYRMLRDGYIRGRVPQNFWQLAALSPVEFAAANYLLALELSWRHQASKHTF